MAIYKPGQRHRYHKILSKQKSKRGVTAILSLTAVVVTVSSKEVLIDRTVVASFEEVKNSKEWTIPNLRDQVKVILEKAKAEQEAKLQNKVRNVVDKTLGKDEDDPNAWRKVTLQADKNIEFCRF